ncbi:MAG: glycosyltransferase [Coriobacteriia bacterium]|nr:glycosyltransferase [Coriobacteriia bacterium]
MPYIHKRIITFVIPCYKSEGSVGLVIDEIRDVVAQRPDFDYRVVAVNDCSPDGTLDVIREIAESDPKVLAVDLAKNGGRHNALMCGCHYADGDYIVFCDDDQQCPMDRLWDLLRPLVNDREHGGGYDVAIAKYPKKTQSAWKNFGSKVNDMVSTWLLSKDPELKFSNFSAMKRFVKDEVIKYTNPYPYLSGLMLSSTKHVCNVEMEERERTIGTGNYSFKKSFSLWLNSFTSFSVKPLRLATFCGFLFATIGLVLAIVVIIRKLLLPVVAIGYSSMMAALLVIGGMIMVMLGLIGEYIGRIYISLNNAPQYVVRNVYGWRPAEELDKDAVQL